MPRILSAPLAAVLVLTIGVHALGQDAPDTPPVSEAAPASSAPVEPETTAPAAVPAADGTTSVVVPPQDPLPAPPQEPAPPSHSPPAAPPPTAEVPPATPVPPAIPADPPAGAGTPPAALPSASAPPAAAPPSPPPSETAAALEAMLQPFRGRLASVGGALDPQLYARPMSLLEPLIRSGDRSRRLWIVQAYWKVSTAYALVRTSAEALERLELIAPGGDPHDRAALDVAVAAARADLADARVRLGASQQELVDLARLPFGEPLPWPVDRPLVDPYQTHFEAIFANRIATGRVRTIVRSLPARHESVASRALAVTAAVKAVEMAEADHARGKRPIESVITAHATLVTQQSAFVEAVRTYNIEIAEYAMAVADLAVPDDRFVAMLIPAPAPWQPQPIAPVSANGLPPMGTTTTPQAVAVPPALTPAVTGIPIE